MELADPSIADGFAACVAAGATEVVAFPYMLTPGKHSVRDIPRLVAEAAARFPGHQGVSVLRPAAGGPSSYTIVVHFRSRPELDAWLRSDERGRLLAEADRHADGELEVQEISGLEGWFRIPGSPVVVAPPRWKMAVVTWVAILPLVELLGQLLVPRLGAMPVLLRPVPVTAISILLMTYLLVPQLTRLLRPWLYPAHAKEDHQG
jgi:antibiotic biosynthesis monooxygenase (ABM) superfamily enzyme